jgi:tetratricopeptide (TPR) repeat protein
MTTPATLDNRIATLVAEVGEDLRQEIHGALRSLRDQGKVPETIMSVSRIVEGQRGLIGCIALAAKHKLKGYNLEAQIEELAEKGIVPSEIASDLHWIRIRANKARHRSERAKLTMSDAETGLDRVLRIIEWYCCECGNGPRLRSIYSGESRPITMQERFLELIKATEKQFDSVRSEIVFLREASRQSSERAQETSRDPVPIPLPALRGTFVDREKERQTLHHLLRQTDMRLVVIVAPGGYGKTELISKILKEVAPGASIIDPDIRGILYLRCLRGEVSLGRIFSEAGRISGRREIFEQAYANRDLTIERKLEFFFSELSREGNIWLVMDNFEDMLADDDTIDDAEIRALFETALAIEHTVRLIATSRAVPRFKGSQRIRAVDLRSGLPEDQAIEYLRAEGADYGLADVEEDLLRAFAKRIHHIPKALESIIGYLSEKYPARQMADLMANDALFADFDHYDTEKGLKRLIGEQFADQRLDARLVLCALSVFPKPAPLAVLRYLLPALDFTSVLPRLERNKLVIRQGRCYDLHPMVREHAYSRIPEEAKAEGSGQAGNGHIYFTREALHARAASFFVELRAPQEEWKIIADIEPQLDGFYHMVRANQHADAARLLNEISDHLTSWGQYRTLIEMHEQLIDKLTDPDLVYKNWSSLGSAYRNTGRLTEAYEAYNRALEITEKLHETNPESPELTYALGFTLLSLGSVWRDVGEINDADWSYGRAFEVSHPMHQQYPGIGNLAAQALLGRANLLKDTNRFEEAGQTCRQVVTFLKDLRAQLDTLRAQSPDRLWDTTYVYVSISLTDSLQDLGMLLADQGNAEEAEAFYRQAVEISEGLWSSNPGNRIVAYALVRVLESLGSLLKETGRSEESERVYRRAVIISEDLYAANPEGINSGHGLAYALMGLGDLLKDKNRLVEAEEAYERAFNICQPLWELNRLDLQTGRALIGAYDSLASLYKDTGLTAEAEDYHRQSIQFWEYLLEKYPENVALAIGLAGTLHNQGFLLSDSGRKSEAEEIYLRSVEISERIWASNPQNLTAGDQLGVTLLNLGFMFEEMGRLSEAEDYDRRAVEIFESLYNANPRSTRAADSLGRALHNLGILLKATVRIEEAEASCRRSLQIADEVWAANPGNVDVAEGLAWALNNLGMVLKTLGRAAEAEQLWLRSIRLLDPLWEANTMNLKIGQALGRALYSFADSVKETARLELAEKGYRRALQVYQLLSEANKENDETRHGSAMTRSNLARLLIHKGRVSEAEETARELVQMLEGAREANRENARIVQMLAHALGILGDSLREMDRFQESEATYRRSLSLFEELSAASPENLDIRRGVGVISSSLGYVLKERAQLDEAEATYRRSLDVYEPLSVANPRNFEIREGMANLLNNLGDLLYERERRDKAGALYRRSLELFEAMWKFDRDNLHYKTGYAKSLCGLLWLAKSRRLADEILRVIPENPEAKRLKQEIEKRNRGLTRLLSWWQSLTKRTD